MTHDRLNLRSCLILRNEEYKNFEQHLILECANENLSFWNLCLKFLSQADFKVADEIIENHLIKKSESPVNLPDKLRKPLIRSLITKPPSFEKVSEAMDHTFDLMIEPYERFKEKLFSGLKSGQTICLKQSVVTPF